ncbi:efflux RND transporter periplasmic adaptor subunit [Leeia sp. TBRC 13508]|uniref:Efflux RND transporter periplasmic adaptor subunit n=1 Tax=Leeia speluncae TaxID=2884804 RepID=A0ABS8DB09_9NEIS|nr:efflux RND transporter periplasmic adaptor subunit [Leeia speluncae]MCB6185312.1 efflux RND transporter periplasmic adaptor subunit [Leeia speluncae]
MKKVVISVLFVAVGLGVWQWQKYQSNRHASTVSMASKPNTIVLLAQDVFLVQSKALQSNVAFNGEIVSPMAVQMTAPVSGKVTRLTVQEGDAVAKGQLLAKLSSPDLDSTVAVKQAALNAASSELAIAERNLSRQQALFQQNFISKNALDEVVNQVQLKRSALVSSQSELKQAMSNLGSGQILSPINGVIAQRSITLGQEVGLHAALFNIVDLSTLELEADIPSAAISQLNVGQKAQFKIEGDAQSVYQAEIARINPSTSSGTRSVKVHFQVTMPKTEMKVGMFVNGEVKMDAKSGIMLPKASVQTDKAKPFVWLVTTDQHLQKKWITTTDVASGNNEVIVSSGLQNGDRIVAIPLEHAVDGVAIQIK